MMKNLCVIEYTIAKVSSCLKEQFFCLNFFFLILSTSML